ncbi:hypothetical protein pb186bvf_007839 [Paramecium bursaria]
MKNLIIILSVYLFYFQIGLFGFKYFSEILQSLQEQSKGRERIIQEFINLVQESVYKLGAVLQFPQVLWFLHSYLFLTLQWIQTIAVKKIIQLENLIYIKS